MKTKKEALIWFFTEIFQFIVFVMGSFMMLWLYSPYHFLVKLGLTIFSVIVIYDIIRNFIYVRFILWKEHLKIEEKNLEQY